VFLDVWRRRASSRALAGSTGSVTPLQGADLAAQGLRDMIGRRREIADEADTPETSLKATTSEISACVAKFARHREIITRLLSRESWKSRQIWHPQSTVKSACLCRKQLAELLGGGHRQLAAEKINRFNMIREYRSGLPDRDRQGKLKHRRNGRKNLAATNLNQRSRTPIRARPIAATPSAKACVIN